MIFLYIGLPLAVAAVLPLAGKASKRVLPDLLSNAVLAGLLVYAATGARALLAQGPIVQQVRWFGDAVNIRIALDGFSLFMLMAIQWSVSASDFTPSITWSITAPRPIITPFCW